MKGLRRTQNMFRHLANPWAYLRYKYFGGKGDFTFRAPNGVELTVPKRLIPTFKEMFFRAPYLEGLPDGHFHKNPPRTVVDIGANVGYFSFFVLSQFPKAKVFAYEPFPPNFELLQSYAIAHPHLGLTAVQKAVAGTAGSLKLHFDPGDSFSTSAQLDQGPGSTVEVETVSLEQAFSNHRLKQVDWLKIDCEGAEYGIFRETDPRLMDKVRTLTVETHDSELPGESHEVLVDQIRSMGFQLHTNDISPLIWAWRE